MEDYGLSGYLWGRGDTEERIKQLEEECGTNAKQVSQKLDNLIGRLFLDTEENMQRTAITAEYLEKYGREPTIEETDKILMIFGSPALQAELTRRREKPSRGHTP